MTHLRGAALTCALSLLAAGCGCGARPSGGIAHPTSEEPAAAVSVEVDTTRDLRPISRWIYGVNGLEAFAAAPPGLFTFLRSGGNRMTAYDWENNASNAGEDYHFQNDGLVFESEEPAGLALALGREADARDASLLLTLSMIGRVAADRRGDGDVRETPDFLTTRFRRSVARCPSPLDAPPDPADDVVCQDQYVSFVERARGSGRTWWSLDNEPGAWGRVHAPLRAEPLTYRELVSTSIEYAARVREVAPSARIFGPALFGWPSYMRLVDAPDHGDRDFLDVYLDAMRVTSEQRGVRLLDVLDLHWYPDVQVEGAGVSSASVEEPVAYARTQLPRSLYDPTYVEPGWIARDWVFGPIELLPRLRRTIDAHYPGTALAITEYHYGGGTDVSGAVAQADVLGAFGRHGVFAAAMWPLYDQEHSHVVGAFRMYRALDEDGARFGDESAPASVSDLERASAWASVDATRGGRVVVMLIARARGATALDVRITAARPLGAARLYRFDPATALPVRADDLAPSDAGRYRVEMPDRGIAALVLD